MFYAGNQRKNNVVLCFISKPKEGFDLVGSININLILIVISFPVLWFTKLFPEIQCSTQFLIPASLQSAFLFDLALTMLCFIFD